MTLPENLLSLIDDARTGGDLEGDAAPVNRAALYGYAKALFARGELSRDALYEAERLLGYSVEEVEALPV